MVQQLEHTDGQQNKSREGQHPWTIICQACTCIRQTPGVPKFVK